MLFCCSPKLTRPGNDNKVFMKPITNKWDNDQHLYGNILEKDAELPSQSTLEEFRFNFKMVASMLHFCVCIR